MRRSEALFILGACWTRFAYIGPGVCLRRVAAMGGDQNYDGICCRFLGISYEQITEVARQTSDEDLLEWAFVHGRRPSQEQILIWNAYMTKRNWRDKYAPRLRFRLEEAKMPVNAALTMFDFIDLDEGRPLRNIALEVDVRVFSWKGHKSHQVLSSDVVVIIIHYLLITNILPQYDLARSSSFSSRSFRRSDARALDASERRSGVERAPEIPACDRAVRLPAL